MHEKCGDVEIESFDSLFGEVLWLFLQFFDLNYVFEHSNCCNKPLWWKIQLVSLKFDFGSHIKARNSRKCTPELRLTSEITSIFDLKINQHASNIETIDLNGKSLHSFAIKHFPIHLEMFFRSINVILYKISLPTFFIHSYFVLFNQVFV